MRQNHTTNKREWIFPSLYRDLYKCHKACPQLYKAIWLIGVIREYSILIGYESGVLMRRGMG